MRTLAILWLAFTFTSICAQNLQISRHYAGNAKNVPVHIYNHNASYFYVLRYNRTIHDLIIERRNKPGAELQQIFPLRLDSVNSKWFDYEKLDYLFFEKEGKLFFVFVKVLNNQTSVYLKSIDAGGKVSGFTTVCTATAEPTKGSVHIEIELDDNKNVLVKQRNSYVNQTTKNLIRCYDVSTNRFYLQYNLPVENQFTGYSTAYTLAGDSSLYYIQAFSRVLAYQKQYSAQGIAEVPVFITDSMFVVKLDAKQRIVQQQLPFKNLYHQFNVQILPGRNNLQVVFRTATESDTGLVHKFFSCSFLSDNLSIQSSSAVPLNSKISSQLNYYDGSDKAEAGEKAFFGLSRTKNNQVISVLETRREQNFFKELLFWQYSPETEKPVCQQLIPRKLFYFPNRTVYRNQAQVAIVESGNQVNLFILEHKANKNSVPEAYFHRSFAKQTQLRTGALVQYKIDGNNLSKRTIYNNADFDWIPLVYDGWDKDFVFYLTKHKAEKWAILTDLRF